MSINCPILFPILTHPEIRDLHFRFWADYFEVLVYKMESTYTNIDTYLTLIRDTEKEIKGLPANVPPFRRHFLNEIIDRLKHGMGQLISEHYQVYCSILTPVHIELLALLSNNIVNETSDHLMRRSYIISYFGTVCTALLERQAFVHLKPFFPTIKLPLLISQTDRLNFSSVMYHNVELKNSVINFLLDFKRKVSRVKPEENLRSLLWAPLLQSFIESLRRDFESHDLELAPEFNFKSIGDFSVTRNVDFVAGPELGRRGLPILLVEISAYEVPEGFLHNDFRKMALMISHELMELIQRAKTHCPDYDITLLKVYGILASGLSFEFCVGTVMKDDQGRINFVFHTFKILEI